MAKTKHPERYQKQDNPWENVKQQKNGKLVGMLTDRLAMSALPVQGQATQSSRMTVAEAIGAHKTHPNRRK